MHHPLYKVEVAPYDDPTNWAEIAIAGGHISRDQFQLSSTFEFSTIEDADLEASDFAAIAGWKNQRGSYVRVLCTNDGSFVLGNQQYEYRGKIFSWQPAMPDARSGQRFSYVARDILYQAQHCGVNVAAATAQKYVEVTATAADFQDEFVLNIPLDSATDSFDYVPKRLLYIASSAYTNDDGDVVIRDYGESDYVYLAGTSQIIFTQSQQELIDAGVTWTIRRLYYDPDDDTYTVKALLMQMLTGDPGSFEGGLGIDHSMISLDEIVSYNGVSAKKIRSMFHDKQEASVSLVLDRLRDEGLLPFNYWLRYDPVSDLVIGSYLIQDNSSVIDLDNVLIDGVLRKTWTNHTAPTTLDGAVALVEDYSSLIFPQNYAKGAPVTLTTDPTFLSQYAIVGHEDNIADGDTGSFIQFQREPASLNDSPQGSPRDLLTVDLCWQTGAPEYRDIRRVTFRGSAPKEVKGDGFIDIPEYYARNQPRVTIVGSLDPITSSNPGNPVSSQAINVAVGISSIQNPFDIDVECDLLRHMRYVGIVFEQEGHFRRSDQTGFNVARMGYMGVSEFGAYGADFLRYPDGDPDAGRVPYAAITPYSATIQSAPNSTNFVLPTAAAPWISVNDFIQINRAGVVHLVQVTAISPGIGILTYTITPAVTGMTGGDLIGYRKRWIEGISGILHDLYRPKLYDKQADGAQQQEQLTSDEAGSIQESEGLCADRLFALWSISHDHEVEHLYNPDVNVGQTISADPAYLPFLVNRVDIALAAISGSTSVPAVSMTSNGTNYEEEPE